MRYYRLWIYLCNLLLILGTLSFCILTATFYNDPRNRFVSLPMYYPTFIYAYGSLVTQGIILPAIGFYGAVKLNQRWLQIYWFGLVAVLIGDAVIGFTWVFLYYNLALQLPNDILISFNKNYSKDSLFTNRWNELQWRFGCCGVNGPLDFNGTQLEKPSQKLPSSCLSSIDIANANTTATVMYETYMPLHVDGCLSIIVDWLSHCVHVLYIVGFCVNDFLKLCFLMILRYEIREMIQKIKILQGDMSAFPELIALGMQTPVIHPEQRLVPEYLYNRRPMKRKRSVFNFESRKSRRIERAKNRLKSKEIEMNDINNINITVNSGQKNVANTK